MSDQERAITPPDLPEVPAVEETLVEKLNETATTMTEELKDLADELVPPVAEPAPEAVAPAELPVEPVVEAIVPDEPPAAAEIPAVPFPEPPPPPPAPPKAAAKAEPEGTSDDRLMAALAWFTMVILQLPIVSIIQLLSSTNKERPFQRHHAVTSLLFFAGAVVYEIAFGILYAILGILTLTIGYICLWPLFFAPHVLGLYYALQAYNGKRVNLPVLSDLGRNQGWL